MMYSVLIKGVSLFQRCPYRGIPLHMLFTVVHDHLDPPRCRTKGVLPSVTQCVGADEDSPLNADDKDTPLDGVCAGRERERERGECVYTYKLHTTYGL